MASTVSSASVAVGREKGVKLLANGDRLNRVEFHRRYEEAPPETRAELVEGTVFMASPLRNVAHARPHQMINAWLGQYWAETPGIECGDNATVILDRENEVQPDALLRIDERFGGRSRSTVDDYIEGAPELIVEIAATSANLDLHQKKEAYRRNGVQEYAAWRTADHVFDWWQLEGGRYVSLPTVSGGVVRSQVFQGLVLDVPALLSGRLADVLKLQQQQIGSQLHAVFVSRFR